jgi:hypothetical protein
MSITSELSNITTDLLDVKKLRGTFGMEYENNNIKDKTNLSQTEWILLCFKMAKLQK